jgi:hypothetical protein
MSFSSNFWKNRAVQHALTGVQNISWHSRAWTRVRRRWPAPMPPVPRVAPRPRRPGPGRTPCPEAARTRSPLESRAPRVQRVRALVTGLCPRSPPATVAHAGWAQVPHVACLTHELEHATPIKRRRPASSRLGTLHHRARAHRRTAIGTAAVNSSLKSLPPPTDSTGAFPTPRSSFHHHSLPHLAPCFAGIRAAAAALPLPGYRSSPELSPRRRAHLVAGGWMCKDWFLSRGHFAI